MCPENFFESLDAVLSSGGHLEWEPAALKEGSDLAIVSLGLLQKAPRWEMPRVKQPLRSESLARIARHLLTG